VAARAARRVPEPRSYTPKHIADKILQSKAALEGERKQVTVLFADLKGSMELAERLDPEEWHAILDRFFRLLTEGVHRFEGTVNQYTGDGIMALFGAPIAHEDHAQRACYAALHLRDELKRYADELRVSRGLNFSVRMGLNSGEVVVGKIGDDLRMDYTARGHTVGLAQRMEQIAEVGHAYLTDRTAALVEGFFELRDLGVSPIKGSREPLRVYALERSGPRRTRLDVSRARGFSKFVGRADEMRILEASLDAALRGEGRVVGVVAEPGIGKSRLCYEFAELCRGRGIAVFGAHGTAHGRQMPILPILELLRGFFDIEEGDSDRIARERIAGRLLLVGEDLREDLPVVFDLMGVPDPAQPVEPIDPDAHHQRVLQVIQRTLFASREPAVLLLEDLHWLDAASDGILARIVSATSASTRLVVVNFRPEYSAPWMEEPYYGQVELQPLGSGAIRELLVDLLGSDPSVARLPELIEARTQGNPFFAEEVVQMLVANGALAGSRGRWRMARAVQSITVPDSVRTILAARIDSLGEREKRVLQTAAVIGKRVPLPLLARAVELSEGELGPALARLRDAEFLYEAWLTPHVEYAFKHPLTEAVAYDSQLRQPRARVHAAVASAIEEFERDRLDEQAARLAYHWEAADEALEAARWHRRAAEWIGLAEPSEALRHWRRVRHLARKLDSPAAAELVALACHQTLNLSWRVGVSDEELRSAVAQCRDRAGRIDPALIVRVLCAYAVCQNFRGAAGDNVQPLTEALRIAKAQRSRDMEIDVLMTLQDSMWFLGRLEEAQQFCTRVIDLTRGDRSHVNFGGTNSYIESLANRGVVRAELGLHREARKDVELALRLSDEQSLGENLLIALRAAVFASELSGAVQMSLPHARRLSQLAAKTGSPLWTLDAALCAGIACASNQRSEEAIALLEPVILRIDERGFAKHDLGRALTALARAYLGAGLPNEATKAAERAVRACRTGGTKSWECMARIVLAGAQLAKQGTAARRKLRASLERVERIVAEAGARAYQPLVCEVRALLARAGSDAEGSERELGRAQRLFTEMGATAHAERIARELAGVRGRPEG
jgi:class 3 adenylate cyclase/tetratricopeptide (TPR) repeat protein